MATSTYGTPYVQGSDLVSAYPTVSSSLATRVDEVSYRGNGLNAQTGTTYTLVAGDAGKTITLSNASPVAVTLPQDSTADLPDGAVVTFYNLGAGAVTISQGTGATLQGGSITLAQYEVTSVIKLSANTYGKFDSAGAGVAISPPTSLANSGGTATLSGNTVTFTTVNSVSLNGCFTASYPDYVLRFSISAVSGTNMGIFARLRAAGTDSTGSYRQESVENYGATVAAAQNKASNLGTQWTLAESTTTQATYTGAVWDILNPQKAVYTVAFGRSGRWTSAPVSVNESHGAWHGVASSYDGITIIASTGTISGTVSIYGYKG